MAITVTLTEAANELGRRSEDERVTRLYDVASELVTEYSRGSTVPSQIQNEAMVRCLGWLLRDNGKSGGVKSQKVNDLEVEYFSNQRSALKQSGAEALLSRFKQRRAL